MHPSPPWLGCSEHQDLKVHAVCPRKGGLDEAIEKSHLVLLEEI